MVCWFADTLEGAQQRSGDEAELEMLHNLMGWFNPLSFSLSELGKATPGAACARHRPNHASHLPPSPPLPTPAFLSVDAPVL